MVTTMSDDIPPSCVSSRTLAPRWTAGLTPDERTMMSEQDDDAELPLSVDSLDELLDALRDARGALSSQADQIGQMRGMFDDADGTIQEAVDDGEHADERLAVAVSFVERLIAERDFDRSLNDEAVDTERRMLAEIDASTTVEIDRAVAAGVTAPEAASLLETRSDLLGRLAEEKGAIAADEGDPEDAAVRVDASDVESIARLLLRSAVAIARPPKPEPAEVLINCTGGVVQDVIVVEGQSPVVVYVEDNDEDEEIGADENPDLAHLQNEDGTGEDHDFSASLYRTSGEAFPGDGRRWKTLRAEAERLEREQRPLTAADLTGEER